jgi:hypothetical protein
MGFSLIASTSLAGTSASSLTTSAINTTGANLIVVGITNQLQGGLSLSDSKGNTWTLIQTSNDPSMDQYAKLYYCYGPSVGAGHTFTVTGSYSPIAVLAFSGAASSPLDQQTGSGNDSAGGFQPGSVTPTQNNELIVSFVGIQPSSSPSVDSGFTLNSSGILVAAVSYGWGMAYLIQTTAGATNPTWTLPGSTTNTGINATFEAASGNYPESVSDSLTLSASASANNAATGSLSASVTLSASASAIGKSFPSLSDSITMSDSAAAIMAAAAAVADSLHLSDSASFAGESSVAFRRPSSALGARVGSRQTIG